MRPSRRTVISFAVRPSSRRTSTVSAPTPGRPRRCRADIGPGADQRAGLLEPAPVRRVVAGDAAQLTVDDLRAVLRRPGRMRRRDLLLEVLGDIEGGARALSELDFTRKVIRQFGLAEPARQVGKRDSRNRQRWIDVVFEKWKVMVEIDGAQHIQPLDQWDDMERDNDMRAERYQVLRSPPGSSAETPSSSPGRSAKRSARPNRRPERGCMP